MKKRENLGQETMEFAVLSCLVVIVLIGTIIVFGDKLRNFFINSQVHRMASSNSQVLASNSDMRYKPNTSTATISNISGYSVVTNDDGSMSFNVNNQKVDIPSAAVNLQNAVAQGTASSGTETLVKELAYMIKKYASQYPDEVPIQLSYGDANKSSAIPIKGLMDTTYEKTGAANATLIKVGNNFVIIQSDQACSSSNTNKSTGCTASKENLYRMEGSIKNINNILNSAYNTKAYSAKKLDTILKKTENSYKDNKFTLWLDTYGTSSSAKDDHAWYQLELDFSNKNYSFSL